MPGENCAFFGCPTSRKHGLSLFKIPLIRANESEVTSALKKKAREEWLRLILRTREMTLELKQRIDANNIYICEPTIYICELHISTPTIYICELHFKSDCILTSKYLYLYFIYICIFHGDSARVSENKGSLWIMQFTVCLNLLCLIIRSQTKSFDYWKRSDG